MYKDYLNSIIDSVKGRYINILPHDYADVDSIISAIMLSKLLDYYNIKNRICIMDKKVSEDTKRILSNLGYDLKKFMIYNEKSNKLLFLVDHYATKHEGRVIGVIDHHFTVSNVNAQVYLYKKSCATAYIIYKLMEASSMIVTKEIIELLAYAMLVDTSVFKSSKTVKSEMEELEKLVTKYNLEDYSKIKDECLLLTDINNMSIDEIVQNGRKNYILNYCNVSSSYIQIKGCLEAKELDKLLDDIVKKVLTDNIDMWVFISFDMQNDKTYVYYITKIGIEEREFNSIVSRGSDIIPKIEDYFYNI